MPSHGECDALNQTGSWLGISKTCRTHANSKQHCGCVFPSNISPIMQQTISWRQRYYLLVTTNLPGSGISIAGPDAVSDQTPRLSKIHLHSMNKITDMLLTHNRQESVGFKHSARLVLRQLSLLNRQSLTPWYVRCETAKIPQSISWGH